MPENRPFLEDLVRRSIEVVAEAVSERLAVEKNLHSKAKRNRRIVRKQEAHGRIIGDAVFDSRMFRLIEEGDAMPPRDWRGYESPTESSTPRTVVTGAGPKSHLPRNNRPDKRVA